MATQEDGEKSCSDASLFEHLMLHPPVGWSIQKAKSELSSKHFSNYEFGQRFGGLWFI